MTDVVTLQRDHEMARWIPETCEESGLRKPFVIRVEKRHPASGGRSRANVARRAHPCIFLLDKSDARIFQ